MRIHGRIASLVAFAVAAVLALVGCGAGNTGGGSSAPPASGVITVYPGAASVPADAHAQVQFSAFLASQPSATFSWSVSGGSSSGTIDASTGLYTPPTSVPSPATVTITATDTAATSEKGIATITIVAMQGLTVSPAAIAVPAGMTATFSASVSGNPVTPTWQVNGITGGNASVGTITAAGVYTAPLTPPSGGAATITAVSGGANGTATADVVFSNDSLSGSYAFSYSGGDQAGPLAVAGAFTANAATGAINGIEDYNSLTLLVPASAVPVSGTYHVYPDGSGSAVLNNAAAGGSETWQFTLAAGTSGSVSRHALLVRFDTAATGSGTIDLQNTSELSSLASISGNYVFGFSGIDDSTGAPLQFAGIFNTDGAGNIPVNLAEEDVNFAGVTTQFNAPDLSLHGFYSLDTNNLGSGRGLMTLENTSSQKPCNCEFAFYMVDSTHLKLVEIDTAEMLSGDVYAAPNTALGSYQLSILNGHYAFTAGGSDSFGNPYAQGGVLIANGNGGITGGVVDTNDGGSRQLNVSLASTSYTVDPTLGRIALPLQYGNATENYAAYAASNGSIQLILLNQDFMNSGTGFLQTSTTTPQGPFALNLSGVLNSGSDGEQDVAGQITIPSSAASTGNLAVNDVENSGKVTPGIPIESSSSLGSADSNGRGTASVASHLDTYPLLYYTIDGNTVLLFGSDSSRTMVGALSRQF